MGQVATMHDIPMNPWVILASLFCLGAIVFQDFRSRSIWIGWFPILLTLGFLCTGFATGWFLPWRAWGASLAFIVLEISIVTLYLRSHTGSWNWKGKLGLGDLLFWLCILPYSGFTFYIGFHLASLIFGLLGHIISTSITKQFSNKIALAGWQALLFSIILVYLMFNPNMRHLLYFA